MKITKIVPDKILTHDVRLHLKQESIDKHADVVYSLLWTSRHEAESVLASAKFLLAKLEDDVDVKLADV